MPRLPIPGGDEGNWGTILNAYLAQAHTSTGSLKNGIVAEANLSTAVQTKLNATTGATGAQGPAGTSGAAGATGPQGPAGATGAQGAAGSNGAQGIAGATGPQGPQGTAGAVGATGAQGPNGATGPQGTAGAPGLQGATGPAGQNGTDGTSVTIAGSVANAGALPGGLGPSDAGDGYITQDDGHLHVWSGTAFSDVGVVRGPEGPTGPIGISGAMGATGATGGVGPAGPTGAQGMTGPVGPGSSTDLTFTRSATTLTLESSTGNDAILPAATTVDAGLLSALDKSKLDGVAASATANSSDATLLNRANHTGSQAQATISNLTTDLAAKANDSSVVHNSGNETINGTKTFVHDPQIAAIDDTNGNDLVSFSTLPTAVNHLDIRNSGTGAPLALRAIGADTDIDLNIVPKGTGRLRVNSLAVPTVSSTDTLTNKTISGAANSITNVSLTTGVTGNLPVANLNTGTNASATTYWRGDGAWVDPPGVDLYVPFSVSGAAYVSTGQGRVYIESSRTITQVRASVGTAPTGASLIIDVLKNGTSIYSATPANRPTITVGSFTALGGAPGTTTFVAGDYITVSVLQVGSSIAGSDLTVSIRLQ